jgi:hypothetical protein
MDKMMAGMGAQLKAVGAAFQTLPKPPYIVLAAQGTTPFGALGGIYVPIYMHKYLHDASDASKGGGFTFAFVKGPVNPEMDTVPDSPKGSVITYSTWFFGGDYPPRIKPVARDRETGAPSPDPRTGAPSRDLLTEIALIVTFEIAAVRKITVDLGLGVAIGPTAKPALAKRHESFYMDAHSWWAATSGVQQKLGSGTVTFLQDLAEMRDVRETLTLKVLRGDKNNADFTGSYVPVRYVKERQPGGSRITVALLNKEQGAPLNEILRVSLGSQQGALSLFDPRFFREELGRRDPVPIPGSMKVRSPLVRIELTLNAQGRVTKATMELVRVNPDMTRSAPVAVLSLTDAWWLAATSRTGLAIGNNGMQFEVRAKDGDIVDRDLRGIAPVPAATLAPIAPSGPGGSNETLTLDVQSGSIVTDFSGKYVPVHYKKRQSARLGGGSFVEVTMLNMDSGGPKTENLVKIGMPQQKDGEMTLLDNRYFVLMPGGTGIVPIRGKIKPGMPCVILSVPLKSWGTITEVTMALTRIGANMLPTNPVAVFGFDVIKAEAGTGHTISRPKEWTINVKASRAKILR